MKKLLLGFGFLILSVVSLGNVYAIPDDGNRGVVTPPTPAPTATTTTTTTPTSTASASSGPTWYEVKLQEPLSGQASTLTAMNGVDLINQYIKMIYLWMASIVGIIAVLMIVVSGIQIIFGGASPELVSDAKTRVLQSLLSLILLFTTALILKTVNPGFFAYS